MATKPFIMFPTLVYKTLHEDKNKDPYVKAVVRMPETRVINGVTLRVPDPEKVTVVVYKDRTNGNAENGTDIDPTKDIYHGLLQAEVGEGIYGTIMTVDHEPVSSVIGNREVMVRQTAILVNALPEDLNWNVHVAKACRRRGIKPLEDAWKSKNTSTLIQSTTNVEVEANEEALSE